ncbi:hypothetical protein JCM16161A_01500 [Vulcanisaeta sp. JCM 16161]|uniref:hypothetical protein n=1 Tax=Vulcanisaeta sp. JCM 16161 TaxID=1295372 RepID=UPI000A80E34C
MLAVAKVLEQLTDKPLVDLTNAAINLHEFRHNGLDETGVFSRYPTIDLVIDDIRRLVNGVQQILTSIQA